MKTSVVWIIRIYQVDYLWVKSQANVSLRGVWKLGTFNDFFYILLYRYYLKRSEKMSCKGHWKIIEFHSWISVWTMCDDVSHWLGASLESTLYVDARRSISSHWCHFPYFRMRMSVATVTPSLTCLPCRPQRQLQKRHQKEQNLPQPGQLKSESDHFCLSKYEHKLWV